MSLHELTIHELGARLKKREISSVELTEAVLARIAATDERVGSYVTLCRERALEEARRADERLKTGADASPLLGIPIALKDIFVTKGVRTTCCSKILGDFVPPYDGTAVAKLKAAGAVTYMHSHRVLLVKGGNPKHVKGPNDLKGLNVAVQAGTKYEQYLKSLKSKLGFSLASYPGDTDAVAQILIGRSDAVLTQDTSAAYQIGQHPGKLAIAYLFPETDTFGIYYRKSDKKLGTALKAAVKKLKKNGTMKKLAAKQQIPASDVK